MTTFSPPVGEGVAWGDHEDPDPHERLMSFYGTVPTGETVWKDENGVWHQGQYPTLGDETSTVHDWDETTESDPSPGLGTAQKVFQGGHVYDIDGATLLDLAANGYAAYLNIAPVEGTWTTEQLAKFDSKMTLTADPPAVARGPFISADNAWTNQLLTGGGAGTTNLREFYLHSDTAGWVDSHGIVEIDPPLFAGDVDGNPSLDILPQMGVCLRAQFNSSTGKNQGITMNNGTIFGIATLNIGAWHAFPDGTGFANRQFSFPFPDFFSNDFNLPYGWEWYLEGNIIRVRTFKMGQNPATISFSDPIRSRTLNLDTDCGSTATVPTPVGAGTNGIINAHMGTDPRSACRIRRFFMEKLS